ncbi:hypothetical protein NC652_039329 [Populus alba x Populus x berolinensis]|nr:hypothetical protein NC652_039329 [Populus alba x Populus x berolinensis]
MDSLKEITSGASHFQENLENRVPILPALAERMSLIMTNSSGALLDVRVQLNSSIKKLHDKASNKLMYGHGSGTDESEKQTKVASTHGGRLLLKANEWSI